MVFLLLYHRRVLFSIVRFYWTCAWIGAAPIFDSGTSLDCGKDFRICKPFKATHGENLRLVTSYDWIDFSKLKGVDEEISEFLSDERIAELLGKERCGDIAKFVLTRIERLEGIAVNFNRS